MDESVKRRMISDVPLGAFLSGGIDSSIIVSLAAKHTNHLRTFSIGFRDEPMFDETEYANLVAKNAIQIIPFSNSATTICSSISTMHSIISMNPLPTAPH